MTRNEIMEMARQTVPPAWLDGRCEYLEAFAKLVAAKERLDCFDAAYQAYATTEVLKAIRARGEA